MKTISRDTLYKLSFSNSKNMPQAVNDGGVRREWVGIGWIDAGKPNGLEPVVVDP